MDHHGIGPQSVQLQRQGEGEGVMDPCGGSAQIETDGMAITGQSEMDGMDGLRGLNRPEADGGRTED